MTRGSFGHRVGECTILEMFICIGNMLPTNLTFLSNPLFFEHLFELITHKSTFLSALLINETFLNTFLRTQKSGFALKSVFLSGFTLLRAFMSAQKSAQGPAQPLCH